MTNPHSRLIAISVIALGLAVPLPAHSQGMMGGGMMGGGMMGGYGSRAEPGPSEGTNAHWDELSSYVQSNGLACMGCHAYSGRGTGPAFTDIAQRFAGHPGGRKELAAAISDGVSGQWPGYPPMPGGLAAPKQAGKLAQLILDLAH